MYNSNLRVTRVVVNKESSHEEVIPKNFIKLVHRNRSLIPLRSDSMHLYQQDDKMNLGPGTYDITTIKDGELFEFNKVIGFRDANSFKNKGKSVLAIIKGTITQATFLNASIFKNFSSGDFGIVKELDDNIERLVIRINDAMQEVSDRNVDKATEILHKSISTVCNNYGLSSVSIVFEKFY